MKIRNIIIVFAMSAMLAGCEYEKSVQKDAPTSVSFKTDVLPIFQKNCVSCHGANQEPPQLTSDIAFSVLQDPYVTDTLVPENNLLYKRMIDKTSPMPPAGVLPQEDIDIIKVWITTGAHDN
jgi:mono/diheme cytochrome c family protein